MNDVDILIIGAGPAGLGMAGRLSLAGKNYSIIEASDKLAVAWHNHYDRLHLHTVKQWSHLPHLPFPDDYPLYVDKTKLTEYYDNYAKHFGIKPIFNQTVTHINKIENDYQIETESDTFLAKKVIIATGVNRVPNIPKWSGQDTFTGDVVHSRLYKNPEPFKGKRVLVVGMGNTGAEVALDLSEHGVDTTIAVRSPISVVPRDLNGQPVQVTSKRLAKIPFGIGDWLGSQIRKAYFGNLEPYGLKVSTLHPAQQLRETGKTPIVDIGTIAAIKKGDIKVKPNIKKIESNQIEFDDGTLATIDAILLATGYRAQIEDFFPSVIGCLDENGLPKSPIGKGNLKGAYFLGYDNYKLGGILGTIMTDTETILNHIKAS